MTFDYVKVIGSLDDKTRLLFYEFFAHKLTVIIRCIWSDETLPDSEKVDRIKWVNEIMHRVTIKIHVLRTNENEWTEEDSWQNFQHWISQNPAIEHDINQALDWSYRAISGKARQTN